MKYTPENITSLAPNEIFVFGSNTAGRHGAGAALVAREKFGAIWGVGRGVTGQCYALPTRDGHFCTLPLREIQWMVDEFLRHARSDFGMDFLVTPVGCGLAGYSPSDIAPMFLQSPIPLPSNVILPESFWKTLD